MRRLSRSDSHKRGANSVGSRCTSRTLRLGLECLEERRVLASWVESFGGSGDEQTYANQQAMDPAGNVYLSGSFNSQPADFDPGVSVTNLSSAGGSDAFVAKYYADGSLDPLFAPRRFGAAGADSISAIAFASEAGVGYLSVTGSFEGSVNFGTVLVPLTLTSAGGSDVFIAKLNAETGATVFAKRIGTLNGGELVTDLAVANNQVYVTGAFNTTLDFDPGPDNEFRTPPGKSSGNPKVCGSDGFILQLNSNGNYVSAYQFGGKANQSVWGYPDFGDYAYSLVADGTSLYLFGRIGPKNATVDLDPGLVIQNAEYSFFAKYPISTTPTWSPDWVRSVGEIGYVGGSTITDADSLYLVGAFGGTQDLDPGPGTAILTCANGSDGSDGFVAKYRKDTGALVWAKAYGGEGINEWFRSGIVVQDVLYLSFRAESASLDFNPGGPGGEVSSGNAPIEYSVLLKLDTASGAYQQVWQMVGTDWIRSYVVGTAGSSVYVAGYFRGTANFPTGGTLTSAGGFDIYLMALEDPAPPPVPVSALRAAATATSNGDPNASSSSVDAALLSILYDLDDSATRKRKKGS